MGRGGGDQPARDHRADALAAAKLEGMWWGDDGAYFVASFARTSDGSAAPHDGQVWFLDPDEGTIELNDSEFAGPCFSGDKKTLFANIQSPGYVLAIQGPWRKQR